MSRKRIAAEKAAGGAYKDQLKAILQPMRAYGTSKHEDAQAAKEAGLRPSEVTFTKIYSCKTYENYFREGCRFMKWARTAHSCVSVAEARQYAEEYIKVQIERGMSPSTIKTRAAALGKIYQDSVLARVETPDRHRSEITRSRNAVERDAHFSQSNNRDFVEFCRSTGLRRHELAGLKCNQLVERDGRLWIEDVKGKGGKVRDVPVTGNQELVRKMMSGEGKVFEKGLPNYADIHSYRADYACRVYLEHARPLDELERGEKYYCRKDMAGTVFDRAAMRIVSNALGHNRIEIIASNYLHNLPR